NEIASSVPKQNRCEKKKSSKSRNKRTAVFVQYFKNASETAAILFFILGPGIATLLVCLVNRAAGVIVMLGWLAFVLYLPYSEQREAEKRKRYNNEQYSSDQRHSESDSTEVQSPLPSSKHDR